MEQQQAFHMPCFMIICSHPGHAGRIPTMSAHNRTAYAATEHYMLSSLSPLRRTITGLFFRALCLCVLLSMVQACASDRVKEPVMMTHPGLRTQPADSLSQAMPQYVLHEGDELEIKFFYNSVLDEEVTVRPDGRILPLVAQPWAPAK